MDSVGNVDGHRASYLLLSKKNQRVGRGSYHRRGITKGERQVYAELASSFHFNHLFPSSVKWDTLWLNDPSCLKYSQN